MGCVLCVVLCWVGLGWVGAASRLPILATAWRYRSDLCDCSGLDCDLSVHANSLPLKAVSLGTSISFVAILLSSQV